MNKNWDYIEQEKLRGIAFRKLLNCGEGEINPQIQLPPAGFA